MDGSPGTGHLTDPVVLRLTGGRWFGSCAGDAVDTLPGRRGRGHRLRAARRRPGRRGCAQGLCAQAGAASIVGALPRTRQRTDEVRPRETVMRTTGTRRTRGVAESDHRCARTVGARPGCPPPEAAEPLVVVVRGALDASWAPEVAALLVEVLARPPGPVLLDAAGVTAVDAAGLGALLVLAARLDVAGRPVHLQHPSPAVLVLLDAAGAALPELPELRWAHLLERVEDLVLDDDVRLPVSHDDDLRQDGAAAPAPGPGRVQG